MPMESFTEKDDALAKAKEFEKIYGYACVVHSNELFYVEADVPIVRNFEQLIYQTNQSK